MKSVTIPGETHVLGASQGYTPLSVCRGEMSVEVGGVITREPVVSSEWEFSLDDYRTILKGGRVRLTILGHDQPPVILEVVPCATASQSSSSSPAI